MARAVGKSPKTKSKKTATSKAVKKTPTQASSSSTKTRRKSTRQTAQENPTDEDEDDLEETRGSSEDSGDEDAYVNQDDDEESDVASLHSDALDDSDFDAPRGKKRKRGSAASSPKKGTKTKSSPTKKRKSKATEDDEEEDDGLEDGQELVGEVVQAPKTGRVPPGRISQNTLDFLKQLQRPECNDRTWFKLHEPVFRQAEKEWKDFLEKFTDLLVEADPEIPPLPPNDVLHRIYRDIRFSNDKTPYKTGFSASFSRSGRKGNFAHYHICIKPSGSFVAGGAWCPGRDEIQSIRNHILHNPSQLRAVISSDEFVQLFGQAKPHPKGKRQNIFGHEDELKNAPKGVAKDHRDIDLLRCRSLAVLHSMSDEIVLAPDFKEKIIEIIDILRPFIHLLNEMITTVPGGEEDT